MQNNIKEMSQSDIETVAQMHAQELKESFLGIMGVGFLSNLYRYMSKDGSFKCFVSRQGSEIDGFIVVTTDSHGFYRRIYLKHFIPIAFKVLCKSLIKPKALIKSVQILFSRQPIESRSELLAVAVLNKGKGIGKKLVRKAVEHVKKMNQDSIEVVVDARIKANEFYRSLGFKKKASFKMHGELMNLYLLRFD